jgi:hypothetical protein
MAKVINLQCTMLPKRFLNEWRELDEDSKTSFIVGEIMHLESRINKLDRRIDEIEEEMQHDE